MITVDFSGAVGLYLAVALSLFFCLWLLWRRQKDKTYTLEKRFLWFCAVCTYTYISTSEEAISQCPRCGSYNRR